MTLSISAFMPSVMMLSVTFYFCYAECHCTVCQYAECRYTECRYAECYGA
jgi:hypothetical protein